MSNNGRKIADNSNAYIRVVKYNGTTIKVVLISIVLASLVFFSCQYSHAEGSQCSCKALKYETIDKNSILIKEGFPYDKEGELAGGYVYYVTDIVGNVFLFDQDTVLLPFKFYVNVTLNFLKSNLMFTRGKCIYKSTKKGAIIKFLEEGVLVKDFDILDANPSDK